MRIWSLFQRALGLICLLATFQLSLDAQSLSIGHWEKWSGEINAWGLPREIEAKDPHFQIFVSDGKGSPDTNGDFVAIRNAGKMEVNVSCSAVGLNNFKLAAANGSNSTNRTFPIQDSKQYKDKFAHNTTVSISVAWWEGPTPQEMEQQQQREAAKRQEESQREQETKARAQQAQVQAAEANRQARIRAQKEENQRREEVFTSSLNRLTNTFANHFREQRVQDQRTRVRNNLTKLESGDLVRCDDCGGTGLVECSACDGSGHGMCIACAGTGKAGYGQMAQRCAACDGTGQGPCLKCLGSLHEDCDRCNGLGNLGEVRPPANERRADLKEGHHGLNADDRILAWVDGVAVHQSEFDAMNANQTNEQKKNYDTPGGREQLLSSYFEMRLLAARAIRLHLDKTEEFRKVVGSTSPPMGDLRFVQLASLVVKRDSPELKKQMLMSDIELKAYYDAHQEKFRTPGDLYSARHILVMVKANEQSKDGISDADAKIKLAKIQAELKAGKKLADLAKEYSDDPGSKNNGGLYENFDPNQMVSGFTEAVKTQAIGVVGEPVKTQFGYHIVEVTAKASKGSLKSFESVSKDVLNLAQAERREKVWREYIEGIKKEIPFTLVGN